MHNIGPTFTSGRVREKGGCRLLPTLTGPQDDPTSPGRDGAESAAERVHPAGISGRHAIAVEPACATSVHEVLGDLLALPGTRYVCAVEQDSGNLIAEVGVVTAGPQSVETVLRQVRQLAAVLDGLPTEELDEGFDDAIVATASRLHLVKRLLTRPQPVLVYLCINRSGSTLASARHAVSRASLPARLTEALAAAADVPSGAPARPPHQLPRRGNGVEPRPWTLPPPTVEPGSQAPEVLQQRWASDVDTMRRILDRLRERSAA